MSQIKGLAVIEELAGKILMEDPDPVVRFLLLRDVLERPPHDQELVQARRELSENRGRSYLNKSSGRMEAGEGCIHMILRQNRKLPQQNMGLIKQLTWGWMPII